jgi:hypothetical protein
MFRIAMDEPGDADARKLEAQLDASRARLRHALGLNQSDDLGPSEAAQSPTPDNQPGIDRVNGFSGSGPGVAGQMANLLLQTWWSTHPARDAAHFVRAVLDEQAKTHPWRLLAGSAAVGAVLVLARPVRTILVTRIVGGLLASGPSLLDHGQNFARKSQQQKL